MLIVDLLQEDSVKNKNLKRVYRYIHRFGPITKVDLIARLKIKQTTLVRILDELLQYQLIHIKGYEESGGGRPPALYEINAKVSYFLGIDLSRLYTKIALVDLSFQPVDEITFTMTYEHTPSVTIDLIIKDINRLLRKNNMTNEELLGIGIGSVGPIDRENGMILDTEYFVAPGWKHLAIVKELKKTFPKKILLENGANTAVLAEYYSSNPPSNSMVYCISGMGLRCGVLTNGRLVQQKTGDASSIGHMVIKTAGLSDKSNPEIRTLSSLISLDAILKESKNRIQNGEHSILVALSEGDLSESKVEHLFKAIRREDSLVIDVVKQSAYYYGIGLANMVNVLHPEHVILSSKLIHEYPLYFNIATSTAKEYIYKQSVFFEKGKLKENAVSIGASILVFESIFMN